MAGLVAVGIAIGAEKLGRKISEKRIERKEKKAAEQREAIYGPGESSSSASAAARTQITRRLDGEERKSEEARRENEQGEQRRSLSSERLPEQPPPRYEDVVGRDTTRAPPYSS